MSCVTPITLKNGTDVPCGRCGFCLRRRADEWSIRLFHEYQSAATAHFVTLTYSDPNLPYADDLPTLVKRDFQLFMKRLRKHHRYPGMKVKYYGIGEYGTKTKRPHYHAIIFNAGLTQEEVTALVIKSWCNSDGTPIGLVHVGTVTQASIDYCTSYIKERYQQFPEGCIPPFALMSKGVGRDHRDKAGDYYKDFPTRDAKGNPKVVPRYYRANHNYTVSEDRSRRKMHQANAVERFTETVTTLRSQGYDDPVAELYARRKENNEKLLKRITKKKL